MDPVLFERVLLPVASAEEAEAAMDASAVVFTPRGGSRWVWLLVGDVALRSCRKAIGRCSLCRTGGR